MVQKTAITEVIKSLADVEERFNLRRTEDEQFFTEWYEDLPEIFDEEDEEVETLWGRIDVLVVQNQFWTALLESKRTTIAVMAALPQTLAYMMANPNPDRPMYGMITNGDAVVFVKVMTQQGIPQYDVSDMFSPFPLRNRLYNILQI